MNKTMVFITSLLFLNGLWAGETHRLDLAKSMDIALNQSYDMRTLKEDFLQAEYTLKATTNRYRTQVSMNFDLPNYTESVNEFEDSVGVYYYPVKRSNYSGDLMITQPLFTDGYVYLSSGFYSISDFENNLTTLNLNTRVGFSQPLQAFYIYNDYKNSLKTARLNYDLSRKRLERSQLDLKYQVSQAFYTLVSTIEKEKIARQELDNQQKNFELAMNKYKAGVIAEVDALKMEIDLGTAQNSYSIALSNTQSQADLFKQLIGIPLDDSLVIDYDLSYNVVPVNLDFAVEMGLKNRLEIKEKEINQEILEINIKQTKASGRINGNITGYYDFVGVGAADRDVAYSRVISDTKKDLKNRPGNKGITLSVSIPVWDWGVNKAKVQQAESNLRQAQYALDDEKITVVRDIRETVNQLNSSLSRLQLLEKNIIVAEKSFAISQERFTNGDIDSQDLAESRDRLTNAYQSRLTAYIDYKLCLLDLTRKTFYDFEKKQEL